MRSIIITILATMMLLLAGTFTSCDFLEVDNVLNQTETLDSLIAKKDGVERLLAHIYSYIPKPVNGMVYDHVYSAASDEIDMVYRNSISRAVKLGENSPDYQLGKDHVNFWRAGYTAIRAANVFIARVDECQDPRITKEKLTEYKNEAKFLRAYYYSLLVNQYGPIILLPDEPIDINTPSSDLPSLRNPYDDCVAYIVEKLDECIRLLPDEYETTGDFGRPTKGTAMAIKSRLLLYAASSLYNGNKDYASFVRKADGVQLINQGYDVKKWELAANASKVLIDHAESGYYELHTAKKTTKTPELPYINSEGDYPNGPGGIDPFQSVKEVFCGNVNNHWVTKELIWGRPNPNLQSYLQHITPPGIGQGDWGGIAPGQGLVDAFFMSDGRTTEQAHKDGDYRETLEFSTTNGYYTYSGTNIRYWNREPRFYTCVSYQGARWKNRRGATTAWYQIDFMGADGMTSDYYASTGHMVRKFADIEEETRGDGVRHRGEVLIRLAEIYLNYIEALNEYSPGHADIKKYLNLIRYRAGIKGYTSAELADQANARKLIRLERRVELAFEMHRYFDSRRWKEAELTTTDYWGNSNGQGGAMYGLNMRGKTNETFYKRVLIENRFFSHRSYLWPLPTSELTNNLRLDQNPGW